MENVYELCFREQHPVTSLKNHMQTHARSHAHPLGACSSALAPSLLPNTLSMQSPPDPYPPNVPGLLLISPWRVLKEGSVPDLTPPLAGPSAQGEALSSHASSSSRAFPIGRTRSWTVSDGQPYFSVFIFSFPCACTVNPPETELSKNVQKNSCMKPVC